MISIDLIVGYKKESLVKYLVDQYKKNKNKNIENILYKNTKINKNLINIITTYSLPTIYIENYCQNYSYKLDCKIFLHIDNLIEFTHYDNIKCKIDNIYIEQYSLVHKYKLLREEENTSNSRRYTVIKNIEILRDKFKIIFFKHKNIKRLRLNNLIFFHFIFDCEIYREN